MKAFFKDVVKLVIVDGPMLQFKPLKKATTISATPTRSFLSSVTSDFMSFTASSVKPLAESYLFCSISLWLPKYAFTLASPNLFLTLESVWEYVFPASVLPASYASVAACATAAFAAAASAAAFAAASSAAFFAAAASAAALAAASSAAAFAAAFAAFFARFFSYYILVLI